MSMKEVEFPIMVKVEYSDYIKTEVTANVVDKVEELFLYGRKTLTEWKTVVFFEESGLKFTKTMKRVSLELCTRGHMLVNLE